MNEWVELKGFENYLKSQGINPDDAHGRRCEYIIQIQGSSDTEHPSYKHFIKEVEGGVWRPRGDQPCDYYGNPINANGTVQAYVIPEYSCSKYTKGYYNILLDHGGDSQ